MNTMVSGKTKKSISDGTDIILQDLDLMRSKSKGQTSNMFQCFVRRNVTGISLLHWQQQIQGSKNVLKVNHEPWKACYPCGK